MVQACQGHFQKIISIELDPQLHRQAQSQFAAQAHITLLQGDSGRILFDLLPSISEPCLFWLDAHAMAGGIRGPQITPILQELEAIFNHPITSHVILIDDARLFVEHSAYPTLQQVNHLVHEKRPAYSFSVEDDVIRISPKL
jgi:hypothetical protein